MIAVHDILRGASLLLRLDRDRHTMLIRATHIQHILTSHSQISHIDVRRDIYTGEMSDMHRTIGIRQRTGYQSSVEILTHYILYLYFYLYTRPNSLLRRVLVLVRSFILAKVSI